MVEHLVIRTSRERHPALAAGPADGPLVLLFHGFPDLPRSFEPVLRGLGAQGYHAVAPYLRGYHPAPLGGPFDAESLASDVRQMADALSPGRPVELAVGHDWGSAVVLTAVALHAERFRRVMLLSVPHPEPFLRALRRPAQLRRSWYMGLFQLPGLAKAAVRRDDYALIERLWRDWSPGLEPPRDHLRDIKRTFEVNVEGPLAYYRTIASPRLMRRALELMRRRVTTPTLYLHGADDGCIGAEVARGQSRYFAGPFGAEIIPNAGHFLHVERPRAVLDRALAWLSARPGAVPVLGTHLP